MKYLITERQLKLIKEESENDQYAGIMRIPYYMVNDNWEHLQNVINSMGEPPYIIEGDVNLRGDYDIETLGSLVGVTGDLNLFYNKVIRDLGDLKFVTGELNLFGCTKLINLGNLEMVGEHLQIQYTKFRRIKDNDGLNEYQLTVGGDFNCNNSDIESLDGLKLVKGDLYLHKTPLSEKTIDVEEIRDIPNLTVEGDIFL